MELSTMSRQELSNLPSPALPSNLANHDLADAGQTGAQLDRQARQEPSTFQPSTYWHNRRVIVTGGAGFLGSFVLEKLRKRGAAEVFVPRIEDYNLVELGGIQRMFDNALQPSTSDLETTIIHLAALAGGIGANRAR